MKESTRVLTPNTENNDGLFYTGSEESADKEISLLDLLLVIVNRRTRILQIAGMMTFLGIVVSLLWPISYTAQTSILPPQNSSPGASLMAQFGNLGAVASLAGGGLGLKNPNDQQVALLKSRTVEDAMLDRFHLVTRYHAKKKSDARKYLENKVDIDSGSKDGLIRVSITDKDPAFAAEMANGYVEEFKKFLAGLAITEASRRRAFFEQQLAEAKDNLANAEEELKRTEQKTGVIQLDSQARATIELVANLRAQIAAKQAQITAMRSFATGENPELQISEQQLLGLQAEAAKIGANSEGATNPLLPKGSMQESSLEYVRKLRDVKYYETIFDLLARQFEAAKVDEARQGALVQIVDQAVVPDRRSAPKRTLMVLGFAIFGVLLGILGVFGSEGLARIAKDPRERERLELLKAHLSHKNGR